MGAAAYPVSYRQDRWSGYQRSSAASARPSPMPMPGVPANDNWPRNTPNFPAPPPPANDNFPLPNKGATWRPSIGTIASIAGAIAKRNPWYAAGSIIGELLKLFLAWAQIRGQYVNTGATLVYSCRPTNNFGPFPGSSSFFDCIAGNNLIFNKPNPYGPNQNGDYYFGQDRLFWPVPTQDAYNRAESYTSPPHPGRNAGLGPWSHPIGKPSMPEEYIPSIWGDSWIDPMQLPIMRPVPFPEPIPYSAIPDMQPNWGRSPYEQTQRGPYPDPVGDPIVWPLSWPGIVPVPRLPPTPLDPKVDPRVEPKPRPRPKPRTDPLRPSVTVEPTITFRTPVPLPRLALSPHYRKPPPRWTKEKKTIAAAPRWIMSIFGDVTEIGDFIESLYDAIPDHLRPKGRKKLTDKAKAVWEHFGAIDMNEALKNIIANELADYIYGLAGRVNAAARWEQHAQGYAVGSVGFGRLQTQMRKIDQGGQVSKKTLEKYIKDQIPW